MLMPLLVAAEVTTSPDVVLTDVIHTTTGPVEGKKRDHMEEFLGIPFAEPPVGDLRFCNPVPKTPWTETRKCHTHGHSCPQIPFLDTMLGDEDCLTLDVYRPAKASSKPLPVYVWIYGGGYIFGDKFEYRVYDPHAFLNEQDMIVVSVNYRLGILGFLANTAIENKFHSGSTGNQALLDQVMALEWVKANIANFGGDPDHVTLGGESAGAFSTIWHMASPASKGLFSAALIESGTGDSRQFYYQKDEAISFGEAVSMGGFNCNGTQQQMLECLRKVPAHKLMTFVDILAKYHKTHFIPELYPAMPWGAVVDGVVMQDLPTNVLAAGKGNNVPVLIGTNQREGSLFLFWVPQRFPGVDKIFGPVIGHFLPNATSLHRALTAYNISATDKYDKQEAEVLLTDYFFKCATRRIVRAMRKAGVPVYQYEFVFEKGFIDRLMKDAHAAELPFVWDNFDTLPLGPDLEQKAMSKQFQYYWHNWIVSRNPNTASNDAASADHPAWPTGGDSLLRMDVPPVAGTQSPTSDLCDMWDDISATQW